MQKKKKMEGKIKIDFCSRTVKPCPGCERSRRAVYMCGANHFFLLEKVNSSALRLGAWLSFSPKLGIVFTSISSAVASNLKIFQKTNLRNFILFSWHPTVSTPEDPSDSSKLSHINNWHKPCHSLDSLSDVRVSSARSKPHLLYLP